MIMLRRPDDGRRRGSVASRIKRLEDELVSGLGGDVADKYSRYFEDCVGFQRDILGRTLWSKQIEICESVQNNRVTVVPSGKAVGKSFVLAGICLWWAFTREGGRVITTGPDFRQVVSVLWGEIRRALYNATEPLPYQSITGGYASPQRLMIDHKNRHELLGFSASNEEGFSGQHAGNLLVVADEASGLIPPVWKGIDGLSPRRLLVSGNPLRYDSRFRELDDLAKSGNPDVHRVHISSLDSPDAGKDDSETGLASRSFIRYMAATHGEHSPYYKAAILGLFPGAESERFIDLRWIDACADPTIPDDEEWRVTVSHPRVLACDIGGGCGGNPSVIIVRDAKGICEVYASEWTGVLDDARNRLEPVYIDMATRWKVPPERCTFDAAGIGRLFGSYLSAEGFPGCVAYWGSGSGGHYFTNRRSQNCYRLKSRLDPHRDGFFPFRAGHVPQWPKIREEIAALTDAPMDMIEGQVRQSVMSAEDLRDKLKRSPDYLDCLAQSFTFT